MKTHYEACKDGSIDSMEYKDVCKLVGSVTPEDSEKGGQEWVVTTREGIFVTGEQKDAEIIGCLHTILEILTRGK